MVDPVSLVSLESMADSLTDLERELIECCASSRMGETTTQLDESMLRQTPGRSALEPVLRGLVARGLMETSRGTFAGAIEMRDGRVEHRGFEDDWWEVTDAGRVAIGAPPWPSSN